MIRERIRVCALTVMFFLKKKKKRVTQEETSVYILMITWGKREFSGWLEVACAACVRFRFAMVRVIWLLHNEQIGSERPAL